jgi:hypothetical protein
MKSLTKDFAKDLMKDFGKDFRKDFDQWHPLSKKITFNVIKNDNDKELSVISTDDSTSVSTDDSIGR